MTSTDLHPEDLLDREMRGDLSPDERGRLLAHMRECAVCRVESLARADFRAARESDDSTNADASRLVAALIAPAPAGEGKRASLRFGMRHVRFGLVAAAIVSVAGLAAASRWSGGRWSLFAKLPASESPLRSSGPTNLLPAGRTAPAVAPSPATAERSTVASPPQTASTPPVPPLPKAAAAPAFAAPARAVEQPVALRESARRSSFGAVPVRSASLPEHATPARQPPDAPALFARANEARRFGDHARSAHYYRALIEGYPASPEAHEALALLGRMLLDDGDAEGALRCFEEYLRVGGVLREDVMLGRALSLRRLGRVGDETRALEDLVAAYPRSVHGERARHRLAELGRP
jgi:TolA-binding protein